MQEAEAPVVLPVELSVRVPSEGEVKRYLLFNFPTYYPSGGWHDFVDSFDSPVEALAYTLTDGAKERYDVRGWQLIDGTSGEEIFPADVPTMPTRSSTG